MQEMRKKNAEVFLSSEKQIRFGSNLSKCFSNSLEYKEEKEAYSDF